MNPPIYEPLYCYHKEGGDACLLFFCLQTSLFSTSGRSMRKGKWDDKPYRKTGYHGDCQSCTRARFDSSL
ncbi:hypothetical protein CJ481_03385 [Bacillus subtilis]|nr:hypothetical protein CJ481_03385 [Bacillus subtilis]